MGAKDILTGRLLGNAQKFTDKQVAETLTMLVEHGVTRGASDIHIEPHERFALIRYRIDGALRGIHKLPRQALPAILAQLKELADLSVADTSAPQEGTYTTTLDDKRVDIRVATMPVIGGEKAVLHISQERGAPLDLEKAGFWGANLAVLQDVLAHPHGLVLVAAPRHHGGASTLFSFLSMLNSPLVSIATVENHPKHRLPGVSQTYLSGGLSMAAGLQAALKQDPNILMLTDIPDGTTANVAVHAASSGHMFLGGLHAEGAIPALLRLRTAGIEPFLLATSFKVAVGQRLVRTLCPDCRERYSATASELREIAARFGLGNASAFKQLHELEKSAAPAIFGDVKQLSSTSNSITHLWRASASGCDTCDRTGYTGRTVISEVLRNTDAMQKSILQPEAPTVAGLQSVARKEGFIPMAIDGLVKALRGQTSIADVLHVLAPPGAEG